MPKRSYSQYSNDNMNYQSNKRQKYSGGYKSNNPIMKTSSASAQIEKKWKDTSAVITPILSPNAPILINGIDVGSDISQRIGRQITMRSIDLRFTASVGTTPTPANVRAVLVYDAQPNGTLPALNTIFNISSSGGVHDTSMMNLNFRDRFWVISDTTVSVSPQGPEIVYRKKHRKINTDTTYSSAASTIAAISTGAVYLCFLPSLVAGATTPTAAEVTYFVRVKYTDQ